jgi:hypothetical protein
MPDAHNLLIDEATRGMAAWQEMGSKASDFNTERA